MQIVQFEIEDEFVHAVGMQSIRAFLEHQLALLRLTCLGEKISRVIQESGVNHLKEVDDARNEAWQEYKNKYLKDIL